MKKAHAFLVMTVLLSCCSTLRAEEHTKDSLDTVQANLKAMKAVLLDVRERDEWDEGHLRDATHVPLSSLRDGRGGQGLEKKKIIYCHCRSGRRVLAAAAILKKEGFDVRPLKFGYGDLLKAGFERAEK